MRSVDRHDGRDLVRVEWPMGKARPTFKLTVGQPRSVIDFRVDRPEVTYSLGQRRLVFKFFRYLSSGLLDLF